MNLLETRLDGEPDAPNKNEIIMNMQEKQVDNNQKCAWHIHDAEKLLDTYTTLADGDRGRQQRLIYKIRANSSWIGNMW